MPRYRFGVFDFDSESAELSRDGLPVRLQAQPAQVLAVLLDSAGQTVARETLRQSVWGDGTFVDFDAGLNFCIAQIRSALRDSADSPRYIRTIPRKGYAFIAPVVTVAPEPTVASPLAELIHPPAPTNRSTRPARVLFAPLTVVLIVAMLAFAGWKFRPAPTAPPAVAVFRLDNNTGDPRYERLADILTDSLVAELTETGTRHYSVIGNDADLRRPRAQRDLLAVGTRLRASVTISGSIRPSPADKDSLEVFAQLITLPDQRHRKVVRLALPADALAIPPATVPKRLAEMFDPVIRAPHTTQ